MANVDSPRLSFTVNLPEDLIQELQVVARYRQVSLDDVGTQACLAYTEPYLWEQTYGEWRREHPRAPIHEMGIDGKLLPIATAGQS